LRSQAGPRSPVPPALEADVRVADLHEAEAAGRVLRGLGRPDHAGGQHAAGRGPDERRARPRHALEKSATIDPIHVGLRRWLCGGASDPSLGHFTITVARIFGWSAQKYSYVPGRVNVCANVSSLPRPAEANAPVVDVIVCVSSSRLVHVTVVPVRISSAVGANLNSLMPTAAALAASA